MYLTERDYITQYSETILLGTRVDSARMNIEEERKHSSIMSHTLPSLTPLRTILVY